MKVKIIKSKSPDLWYADKIGEIFEVNKIIDGEGMYKVKQKNIYAPSFIYAEDTIEIKSDNNFNPRYLTDYPNEGRIKYLNTRFDDYPYNGN